MDKGYSQVLYDWIQAQDNCWFGGDLSNLHKYVTSDCNLSSEYNYWYKVLDQQRRRGLNPLKRESNLIYISEHTDNNWIDTLALLNIRQMYEIKGETYNEEQEVWYGLRFAPTSHGWKITALFPQTKFYSGISYKSVFVKNEILSSIQKSSYDPQKAVRYANKYWNSYNPQFRFFKDNDCTNFISQCLYAGGFKMKVTSSRSSGWWYKSGNSYSYSWAGAHALYSYLMKEGKKGTKVKIAKSPYDLQIGDVICYDWFGDKKWNHNVIVTKIDANGAPLVNAHTTNSYHRYWEYKDSKYWTPKAGYAFFKIM